MCDQTFPLFSGDTVDKYKDMNLEQLQAEQLRLKTAFAAFKAANPSPTAGQMAEAQEMATDMGHVKSAIAALSTGFASMDATFADEPEKEEEPAEEKSDDGASEPSEAPADEPQKLPEVTKGGSGNVAGEVHQQESPGQVVDKGNVADNAPLQTNVRRSAVEQLSGRRPGEADLDDTPSFRRKPGKVRMIAAPDVQDFAAGQDLGDLLGVAKAAMSRARGFTAPNGNGGEPNWSKFPTATFALDIPDELMVDERSSEVVMGEVMDRAADESSLPGDSLVAAGGWCAPSETVYDLSQDATLDGILSLPEIGVRRGGLKWPVSPTFADFYANPGFVQTEAQAIAGTTKPCVEVDCPDFAEARLDVEGLCVRVPILTEVGYPEHVKNFVDGTLVAHAHWINANIISRILTIAGATVNAANEAEGSTFTDTLNILEAVAERTRQRYRLGFNTSLEVILPVWVRSAMRADAAHRAGVDPRNATMADSALTAAFRERKLAVQWVYDWQELPLTDTGGTAGIREDVAYPTTFEVLMYPAGTLVKGTANVINLSTVYDAASLATNTYTGLFTEQGLLVANRKFHVTRLTLPVCNAGRTGASNITC
jgi:hypothetical protein